MNKTLSLSTILLFAMTIFIGCNSGADESKAATTIKELTSDEKEAIKKAISSRIDEIIQGAKELNIDKAISVYSDDDKFIIVNPDASVTDFATMQKMQAEGFHGLKALNFSTVKQDFTFLSSDLVMCTWIGKNEFEMTTGEKMKIDPYVGSLLFKKENGIWKIIYAHETTAAPTPVK